MTEKKKAVYVKRKYQKTKRLGLPMEPRRGRKKINANWTEADWNLLLERFANGEMLIDICSENTSPSREAFYHKCRRDEKFKEAYALARQMHVDAHAEKTQKIADNCQEDFTIEAGKKVYHSVPVSRAALRVKTAQWRISKLDPKGYGDKNQIEVSGDVTSMQPVINIITGGGVDDDEDSTPKSGATSKTKASL